MAALVERTSAQAVWCLGDSFHDGEGPERLSAVARTKLSDLASRTDWVWITGNHDMGGQFPFGRTVAEAELDGIWLRHEACPDDPRPEISGHFHPRLRMARRGVRVSRRCFVTTDAKLILPAFGAMTGGMDAGHEAVRMALGLGAGEEATVLVPASDRLLRFPLGSAEGTVRRARVRV